MNNKHPVIVFQIMRYEDEIKLLSDSLYDSICNHRLINEELFKKYPKLLNRFGKNSTYLDIYNYCYNNLEEDFNNNLEEVLLKIKEFESKIDNSTYDLLDMIAQNFEMNWDCEIITIKIGNVALCPRWIKEKTFYIPAYIKNFYEVLLHECCHFAFFKKLLKLNSNYSFEDFEYPNREWILSEILIDVILGKEMFESKTRSKIRSYDEFYDIYINNHNLVDCIRNIYNQKISCKDKIYKSLDFISSNNKLILCRI